MNSSYLPKFDLSETSNAFIYMRISKRKYKQTLKEDTMDIVKCFLFGHLVSFLKYFAIFSFNTTEN